MGILGKKWKIVKTEKHDDNWTELEEKRKELFEKALEFLNKED